MEQILVEQPDSFEIYGDTYVSGNPEDSFGYSNYQFTKVFNPKVLDQILAVRPVKFAELFIVTKAYGTTYRVDGQIQVPSSVVASDSTTGSLVINVLFDFDAPVQSPFSVEKYTSVLHGPLLDLFKP